MSDDNDDETLESTLLGIRRLEDLDLLLLLLLVTNKITESGTTMVATLDKVIKMEFLLCNNTFLAVALSNNA